jgi:hypothetical protein
MHVDLLGLSLGLPLAPGVLKLSDKLLLFGVHRDDGLGLVLELFDLLIDEMKLGIPIGVRRALLGLGISLKAIACLTCYQ